MPDDREDKVLAEITQRQGLLTRRTFTLFRDRLQVAERMPNRRVRRFLYLGALRVPPDLVARPIKELIVLAIVLVIAGAVLITHAKDRHRPDLWAVIFACAVCFAPAMVSLLFVLKRILLRVHVLTYTNPPQGAAIPDLWLSRAHPSAQAVQDFLTALAAAYEAARSRAEALTAAMAAGAPSEATALEQFAKLRADGIIAQSEFDDVKAKVLGDPRKRIGFGSG